MIKTFLELVTIHCVYVFYNDVIVVLSLQGTIMLMFIHVEIS